MTMTNLAMEMGVKCAFVPPDEKTAQYLESRLEDKSRYQPVLADADAVYAREIDVDLSTLEPMVACPHEVENTKPIGEVTGTRIDQAHLGSCANAKYEDLVVAAGILKGRHVDPRVRLIVTPGSKQIMLEAMKSGVLATLLEAGGMVTNPGCGACAETEARSPMAKFVSPRQTEISSDGWEAVSHLFICRVPLRWRLRRFAV